MFMKVADIMSSEVDFVTTDTNVIEVCRLIFGRGINGVPVCKDKKVVGFITERDILAKFYPSMQDYVEDPVHMGDFEGMEGKISEILSLKAEKLMTKNPTTVTPVTPVLKAQSLMFLRKVGRLPVINEKGNLVGIISNGDIFRTVVGKKIPYVEDEEYHDWLSRHYDLIVSWEERLGHEIPDLISLFNKNKIKKIWDVGSGTGEHAISLARKGFHVVGLERSSLMFQSSKSKWDKLPEEVKKRVEFIHGNYIDIIQNGPTDFEAAIFMGNAFPHNPSDYKKLLEVISKNLSSRNAIMVFQIVNYEKVFKTNKRLQDFNIGKAKLNKDNEYAFLEFYDPAKESGELLTLNMAIFAFNGKRWMPRAFNNTPIANIDKNNISSLLNKNGFKKASVFGGMLLGSLFKDPFDPVKNDWLNVVARRS